VNKLSFDLLDDLGRPKREASEWRFHVAMSVHADESFSTAVILRAKQGKGNCSAKQKIKRRRGARERHFLASKIFTMEIFPQELFS